eukprot:COSAG01_NODE_635_length_14662_cov_12.488773_12_plen_383_part_00
MATTSACSLGKRSSSFSSSFFFLCAQPCPKLEAIAVPPTVPCCWLPCAAYGVVARRCARTWVDVAHKLDNHVLQREASATSSLMSSGSPSPQPLAERIRARMAGAAAVPAASLLDKRSAPAPAAGHSTAATAARDGASSSACAATAVLLARLFGRPTATAACEWLASPRHCTRKQRVALAELAGLERQWVSCDQAIPENIADMCALLVAELYEPFWFYRGGLVGASDPRALFGRGCATKPLKKAKGYWTASSAQACHPWLPALPAKCDCEGVGTEVGPAEATFDAVVQVVQGASGTGVHVHTGGAGFEMRQVLTCAHVVAAGDDDGDDDGDAEVVPQRVGRRKLVMFPSGRTFIAQCAAVHESVDGSEDVAVVSKRSPRLSD